MVLEDIPPPVPPPAVRGPLVGRKGLKNQPQVDAVQAERERMVRLHKAVEPGMALHWYGPEGRLTAPEPGLAIEVGMNSLTMKVTSANGVRETIRSGIRHIDDPDLASMDPMTVKRDGYWDFPLFVTDPVGTAKRIQACKS